MPPDLGDGERCNGQGDGPRPAERDRDAFHADAHVLLPRLFERRSHMQYHVLAQHAEQTQIGFARVRGEVRPHVSAELDNAQIVVDHH